MGASAFAAPPAQTRTLADGQRTLATLSGCWRIEGHELSNAGEFLKQKGLTRAYFTDDARRELRLSRGYEIVEATGHYKALPRERRLNQIMRARPDSRFLTMEDAAAGPASRREVSVSDSGDELFWMSMFRDPARAVTLVAATTYRLVSKDLFEAQTTLRDPHGPFQETYIEIWRRAADDATCTGM